MASKPACELMLALLLFSVFAFASGVQLSEGSASTLYIRADGSVDPATAPIRRNGNLYVLTDNVRTALDNDGIIIERSKVTLDGAGYTIKGAVLLSFCKGIRLLRVSNVTVRNVRVDSFYCGVCVENSSSNDIIGNKMINNSEGIELYGSSNNRVSGNTVTGNDKGIVPNYSSNNTIVGNSVANNTYGIFLVKSFNCTIVGNTLMASERDGVCFVSSSGNIVANNNVTGNGEDGIYLDSSLNNDVFGNSVTANGQSGIVFRDDSDFNRIHENEIWANEGNGLVFSGINGFSGPSGCNVSRNTITDNGRDGIELDGCEGNRLVGNALARNLLGLEVNESSGNSVYHNNFVDNANQAATWISLNVWNNSVEGNYWSGFDAEDLDKDGVMDSPFVIGESNADNCPLLNPYLPGDVNHDGKVNIVDVNMVGRAVETERGDRKWNPHADVDENGRVNVVDLAAVAREFGKVWKNP